SASPPTYLITPAASDNTTGLLNNYTVTYTTAAFTISRPLTSARPVATTNAYTTDPATDPVLTTLNSGFVAADLGATKISFSASQIGRASCRERAYITAPAARANTTGLLNNSTDTSTTAAHTSTKASAAVRAVAIRKT